MPDSLYLLSAVLSTISDAAYALMVGILLARAWLAALPPACAPALHLLRRGLAAALGLYTLAHLIRPWFIAAGMSGSAALRDNLALVPSILTDTHQGRLWFYISAALLLLWPILLIRSQSRLGTGSSIAALALISFSKAAASHAGGDGDYTLTALSQTLHILATAVWAGAILVSTFLVLPRLTRLTAPDPDALWLYAAHLSRAATLAIIVIALSGAFTTYRELNNSLSGIWMSSWGKILIAKVSVVFIALALGACSRFLCLRNTCTPERRRLFSRLLTAEAWAMVLILCLSGLLGNTSPAMPPMAM